MPHITDRQISFAAMLIAFISALISAFALFQSNKQFGIDYDSSINISPGALPVKTIPSDKALGLELTITNTSKSNLKYFIRAESNVACITGESAKPKLLSCIYESRTISLSKPEAGAQKHKHKLNIKAFDGVDIPALAYSSDPIFYLNVEIIDAGSKKVLSKSKCYYSFEPDLKSLVLYEVIFDSDQKRKNIQSECSG